MTTRRDFLKGTAAVSVAATTPYFWTRSDARAADENSKPTVAAIGVGGSRGRYNRGRSIALQAAKHGQMIAVCDVDELHAKALALGGSDEGAPGVRRGGFYAAYFRDLDGNKLNFICMN